LLENRKRKKEGIQNVGISVLVTVAEPGREFFNLRRNSEERERGAGKGFVTSVRAELALWTFKEDDEMSSRSELLVRGGRVKKGIVEDREIQKGLLRKKRGEKKKGGGEIDRSNYASGKGSEEKNILLSSF